MTSKSDIRQPPSNPNLALPRSSRRKRICIVVPTHTSYLMGGAQYQVGLLIDGLIAQGFDDIHYLARRFAPNFEPHGYSLSKIRSIPYVGRLGRFAGIPSLALQLARIQPDIIYQRVASAYTGYCAWYAKRTGAKLIWHIALMSDCEKWVHKTARLRQPHKWLERAIIDYGIRGADTIVAQTEEQNNALFKNYGRTADHVIRNFHELPTEPIVKAVDKNLVLWVANMKPSKRPELFIDIACSLANRSDLEFRMIGGPSEDTTYMRMLESKLNNVRNLKWLGGISQEEVNAELAKSHLLVNTSIEEGFSNTFIQAWMRGTPVVTLNIDPDGLIREHGLGGVAESTNALRELIDRLTTNDDLLEELSQNAILFGQQHFSICQRDRLIRLFGDGPENTPDYQAIPS